MTQDEIEFITIIRNLDTDKLEKAIEILKSFIAEKEE